MSKTSTERSPGAPLQRCTTSGTTMGTRWSAQFYAPVARDVHAVAARLDAAVAAVDAQMSNWRADSDLSRLNRAAPGQWVDVPRNLATVLARALEIARATDDAFNIGVGRLVGAWGFGPVEQRAARPPAQAHPCPPLREILELDEAKLRARRCADVALDLCGIAKGFGVDELGRVLDAEGLPSWLVGIDGEMRARGAKPDGTAWAIAVEAPDYDKRTTMGVIELADGAIATSGDYRHWIDVGAQRISHTMDPRSGAPVRNGIASVTVVAPDCTRADAFATAFMVLGVEAGLACARRQRLEVLLVVRERDGLRTHGTGCFTGAASPA
jgi:thiamine biosynthesis lipoprotein